MNPVFAGSATGLIFAIAACGCAMLQPDQVSIHESHFWTDARIETRPAIDPDAETIRVTPGTSTVLMTEDGLSHGRTSSAHASHDAVFMTVPSSLVEGQTYVVSSHDGTLHYEGFAGSTFWYVDPDRPAWAEIEVREIDTDSIKAHVHVELTVVNGSQGLPSPQRPHRPLSIDKTLRFQRKAV
jgi:hypothetical protein